MLRQYPDSEGVEEIFHQIDRGCRWPVLPAYYHAVLMHRLPGGAFFSGFLVLVLISGGIELGLFGGEMMLIWFAYLLFLGYALGLAPLIGRACVRLFPYRP